jgi:hypothetical protein
LVERMGMEVTMGVMEMRCLWVERDGMGYCGLIYVYVLRNGNLKTAFPDHGHCPS